jgi:hypothetical protein
METGALEVAAAAEEEEDEDEEDEEDEDNEGCGCSMLNDTRLLFKDLWPLKSVGGCCAAVGIVVGGTTGSA